MQRVSQVLSRLPVAFDDPKSVASAGLMLPMSLAQQLDIESGCCRPGGWVVDPMAERKR